MEFTVRLADVNIAVKSLYDEVYSLCSGYLTDGTPDIEVVTSPEDIDYERLVNVREAQIEGIAVVDYPASYLETLAVYRRIVTGLLDSGIIRMHGAVVAVEDKAWLFTAPSGTGKTTHINLWLENIPGSYVVNGDKPLIRVADGEWPVVYGTPWAGKEGMNRNVGVRLCGIVILDRGQDNQIEQVSMSKVLPTLIQQSYRPRERQELQKTLALISRLGKTVPLYHLHCNMDPSAATVAYEALNRKNTQ